MVDQLLENNLGQVCPRDVEIPSNHPSHQELHDIYSLSAIIFIGKVGYAEKNFQRQAQFFPSCDSHS